MKIGVVLLAAPAARTAAAVRAATPAPTEFHMNRFGDPVNIRNTELD